MVLFTWLHDNPNKNSKHDNPNLNVLSGCVYLLLFEARHVHSHLRQRVMEYL